jgi:rod shape-determining protein MreC
VAGFASAGNRPIYGRGSAAGLSFTVYAIMALLLMYFDQRQQWSVHLRYGLQTIAYPVQVVVSSPTNAWRWLAESFATRNTLSAENIRLHAQLRELQLAVLREQGLEAENAQLRGLNAALPPLVRKRLLAEVISVETNPLRQRLIINKGARDGVFVNQAAVDGQGILGQVASVGPWSAEVILLTDPEHALPVQIVRNQLRSIAVGSGNSGEILLPYLAVNSDVKSGDMLLSSGLGGVFPAGYPVARVIGVRRGANELLAQVRAEPLARPDRVRELMLIEFDTAHPAAPASSTAIDAAAATRPAKP